MDHCWCPSSVRGSRCLGFWLSGTFWVPGTQGCYDGISLQGICLGRATNNIAEYNAVVELLVDAISLRIRHLVVRLDSQLVVLQLSNVYYIRSPTLLRVYLRIRLLERHFDHIEYQHIPRCLNTLTDALANYVLDRHLNHL